jgi:trans-aconitate methyltransferase
VYAHILPATSSVVSWVRGTTLNRFKARLPADLYESFVATYEDRLLARVGHHAPFLFPFKRILFWGRRSR